MTQKSLENIDPRTGLVIGAAVEVHRQLGYGFLEAVYQEALALEFSARNIPFQKEVPLKIRYKEQALTSVYKADFICFENIVVELKAIKEIGGIEKAQVIHYLKASDFRLGLLLNFGAHLLQIKRLILDPIERPILDLEDQVISSDEIDF